MKFRSDDELEILEKRVKKKQISLNSYFGCSSSFNNVKNDSKAKKTFSSSALRLLKSKTVEENWIKKFEHSLMQETDYSSSVIVEYATVLCCKVLAQFREHITGINYSKEDWIAGLTN